MCDTPLGNFRRVENWLESCLIHIVQSFVGGATVFVVLPGEVQDWARELQVAIRVGSPVVLWGLVVTWPDHVLEFRYRVE